MPHDEDFEDDGSDEKSRCTITWAKDPSRDIRLLDWIDQHQFQREIMFANTGKGRGRTRRQKGGTMNKIQCYIQAAKSVFSVDDDDSMRQGVAKDPKHFALATSAHLVHMRATYQRFNEEIGPASANLRYEEIEVGSEVYKKVAGLLEWFPLWKRLHVHWRTNMGYNQFYNTGGSTSTGSGQKGDKTHSSQISTSEKIAESSQGSDKRGEESNHDQNEHLVGRQSTSSANVDSQPRAHSEPDIIDIDEITTEDEGRSSPKKEDSVVIKKEPEPSDDNAGFRRSRRKRKRAREIEEEDGRQGPDPAHSDSVVAVRKHERDLAELALKRQKLENEALEKKTAAETRRLELEAEERRRTAEDNREREKENHEFMMRLMELAMVKGPKRGNKAPAGELPEGP